MKKEDMIIEIAEYFRDTDLRGTLISCEISVHLFDQMMGTAHDKNHKDMELYLNWLKRLHAKHVRYRKATNKEKTKKEVINAWIACPNFK